MKEILQGCISLLICALLISIIPTEAEAEIYGDTVRLHILAASDSKEDQLLKLKIRDRLLEKYGDALSQGESAEEAERMILSLIHDIERDIEAWIDEEGYDYTATVTLTEEWYERREYADFSLPEGGYSSLKVIIGEGGGENWWCVMYPPLCLDIATAYEEDGYTDAEKRVIKAGKYNIKVKLLEIFSEAFYKTG